MLYFACNYRQIVKVGKVIKNDRCKKEESTAEKTRKHHKTWTETKEEGQESEGVKVSFNVSGISKSW